MPQTELSFTEENYLKAIYHLSVGGTQAVSTNAISDRLQTKPASASDMVKRLARKKLLQYEKYQGANISPEGIKLALKVIRKHRLWEVFLVEKLNFNWDEVHEIAEQLEHIRSPLLIRRLDEFLGFPKHDPHGDPIPDENGSVSTRPRKPLSDLHDGESGDFLAVKDTSSSFLQYLDKLDIQLGANIRVMEKVEFDDSMKICLNDKKELYISAQVASNLYVSKN
ncbi:MAG TPA: iron-dependent repressor [Cytophagales bacterium]|jgi:DtxR family Mn-dependent transcriptional regulator|nr:iron-dependent repressor [Cytophagales bacterium]